MTRGAPAPSVLLLAPQPSGRSKPVRGARRMAIRLRQVLLGVALAGAGIVPGVTAQDLSQVVATAMPGPAAVFRYNNRPITVLRASVLSRPPAERAAAAVALLDRIVHEGMAGPVSSRQLQGARLVSVGGRDVFALLPLDVDEIGGETLDGKVAAAVSNLQLAVDEAVELRTPRRIATSIAMALVGTAIFALALWSTRRLHRGLVVRFARSTERRLQQLSAGNALIMAARAPDVVRYVVTAGFVLFWLLLTYSWLTFTLRRFPYTRPWGESLRTFILDRLASVGLKSVGAVPDLFTVLLIVLLTRIVVRVCQALFRGAEEGRLTLPYVYPETAQPTRRLVSTVIWLLGLVLAYPYLPGSDSDAFKGVSVFLGVVLSLGSSGIVNQMMSGLTITYSRALRTGDFVRIGDVEGTVVHLGSLSTKVKTVRREEVTIPNAVVMSHVTTNFSRFADSEGVFVPTSLTIGYDTPWRQVHALLLLAAGRTPGVRTEPAPVVRQTALQDFYVQYTLMVCLETPSLRGPALDALHANIQDAFNEYGVQIMSPNYEADPSDRKVVPAAQWYAAPARPSAGAEPV